MNLPSDIHGCVAVNFHESLTWMHYQQDILARIRSLTVENLYALMDSPDRTQDPNFDALVMAESPPPGEAEFHEKASIATTLSPLLDEAVQAGSTLRVVGSNRPNLSRKGYRWRDDLVRWIQKGVEIRYFLIQPTEKCLATLRSVAEQSESGKVHVWHAAPLDKPSADEDAAWLEKLESTHFATLTDPDLVWYEAKHERNSLQARDCFYYPPQSVYGRALASVLSARFDRLAKSSYVKKIV